MSSEIKNLALALSKAQSEFKTPKLNKRVEIKTMKGQNYKFDYADLNALYEATKEALTKYELSHTFIIENNTVIGMLMHSSGERLVSSFPLAQTNDIKALGSNITYARRYIFQALVSICGQEDTDGAQEDAVEVSHGPKVAPAPINRNALYAEINQSKTWTNNDKIKYCMQNFQKNNSQALTNEELQKFAHVIKNVHPSEAILG